MQVPGRGDGASRDGRGAAEALEPVERGPLGTQERVELAANDGDRLAGGDLVAVADFRQEADIGVERGEGGEGEIEAADGAFGARSELRVALSPVDVSAQRSGRDIKVGAIFCERGVDEALDEVEVERGHSRASCQRLFRCQAGSAWG